MSIFCWFRLANLKKFCYPLFSKSINQKTVSDFLNSIAHSIVEIIMEEKKPGPKPEPKPVPPLSAEEHRNLLVRMYCMLATLGFLVGSLTLMR
jgi:hypothetical protein